MSNSPKAIQRRPGSRPTNGMLVAVVGVVLVSEQHAFAYIDPGTGSLIYQALLAGLLGLGFVFRRSTDTLRAFAQNLFGKRDARSDESRPEQS